MESDCAWRPPVDIFETERGIVLKVELPGIDKKNVSVEVKDTVLTIRGERPPEADIQEERYYRKERCFGSFRRSFTLRDCITPDTIKATYKDGVLEVEVAKPESERPKLIKVDIT